MKKPPEYIRVGNQTMTTDEAMKLWAKAGVPPGEIKKQLMVVSMAVSMLSPLKLRRLHKELNLD